MKTNKSAVRKLSLLLCLILVFALTACGKKDSDKKEASDTEVTVGTFKVTIDKSFIKSTGKYDSDDTKYFEKNLRSTSLVVHFEYTNHASHDAAMDFLRCNASDAYSVLPENIRQEKIDDNQYYLFWDSSKDDKELTCGVYVRFEQDSQLSIYEINAAENETDLRSELDSIAQTAVYTGKQLTVKDEPYYIENQDFRVKIDTDFDSPQLQQAVSVDPSTDSYIIEKNQIGVYYKAADTFDRGDSYFKINVLSDQDNDIYDIAKEKTNPKDTDNEKLAKELEETTMGAVWPNITDEELKNAPLYKVSIVIEDNPFAADSYYLSINGRNYTIGVLYPVGDDVARQTLTDQFYQVEFIYNKAE